MLQYAKSRPTVLLFHANAGNVGHRVPIARKFNADYKCNVFMLSYRGSACRDLIVVLLADVNIGMDYQRAQRLKWASGKTSM